MSSNKNKRTLKDFGLDFNKVSIVLPDNSNFEVDLNDLLLVNHQVPGAVLDKLSNCSANYAKFGTIRADIISYINFLEDQYDEFDKKKMNESRNNLPPRSTEGVVKEKSFLDNSEEYMKRKKEIRMVRKIDEKIHRIMKALEMNSESLRSISSYIRKDRDISFNDNSVLTGEELKNTKKRRF